VLVVAVLHARGPHLALLTGLWYGTALRGRMDRLDTPCFGRYAYQITRATKLCWRKVFGRPRAFLPKAGAARAGVVSTQIGAPEALPLDRTTARTWMIRR
jgi:hypothetical protein